MSEAESHQEMVGRVEAMARDKGETWDLSENDQSALGYVLGLLAEGCDVRCMKCMAPNAGVRSVCGSCGAVLPHADATAARESLAHCDALLLEAEMTLLERRAELRTLRTRTEKMERALREIADFGCNELHCVMRCRAIAREALADTKGE